MKNHLAARIRSALSLYQYDLVAGDAQRRIMLGVRLQVAEIEEALQGPLLRLAKELL